MQSVPECPDSPLSATSFVRFLSLCCSVKLKLVLFTFRFPHELPPTLPPKSGESFQGLRCFSVIPLKMSRLHKMIKSISRRSCHGLSAQKCVKTREPPRRTTSLRTSSILFFCLKCCRIKKTKQELTLPGAWSVLGLEIAARNNNDN